MLALAVTAWLYALVASTALLVVVVLLQGAARMLRTVRLPVREVGEPTVVVPPVPSPRREQAPVLRRPEQPAHAA